MGETIENNKVELVGEIASDFTFSHEVYGEGFYMVDLKLERLSDQIDVIPVMVSERLVDINNNCVGSNVSIAGQFRSYNKHEETKNRLILSVFAREFEFIEEEESRVKNSIYLEGYLVKPPIYRKTPLGREICDLLLAVNRPYGKTDYIPCICWGRTAKFASRLEVSNQCAIWGRIQSRQYYKRLEDDQMETRIAYEVSAGKLVTMN